MSSIRKLWKTVPVQQLLVVSVEHLQRQKVEEIKNNCTNNDVIQYLYSYCVKNTVGIASMLPDSCSWA